MNTFSRAYDYAAGNLTELSTAFQEHLLLVLLPLLLGLLIGLPLGVWSARSRLASTLFTNGFNALRVIPSLAILFLATSIPFLGLSFQSAVVALTLLALPPILINTDVAFRTINPKVQEAARGMGMNPAQILRSVEIPLALPVILAGIKTALVEVIASATLAAFIGAGGLGTFIVRGFALYDIAILLVGAIPVALLAMGSEIGLTLLQRALLLPRQ